MYLACTFLKKITSVLILVLFLLNNCTSLTGINKSPNKKKPNKKLQISEYSINDVTINIVKINELSNEELNKYNTDRLDDIKDNIKHYSEIYDYRYEYILGIHLTPLDIDLTDTDDLDGCL